MRFAPLRPYLLMTMTTTLAVAQITMTSKLNEPLVPVTDMEEALQGRFADHPVWPAFHHTVRRFGIPLDYFRQMIAGISSDLEPRRLETFDELYQYCYQVASVVGLTTIHIFGFDTPSALPLAEKCGVAFQLTNILRDIREDAERGRIYLPAEDLRRFGVTEDDLRAGNRTPAFLQLMRFEAARARAFLAESGGLRRRRPRRNLVDHPFTAPITWPRIR